MSFQQYAVAAILVATLALFVRGRPRYDVVSLCALLATAVLGLVPPEKVFTGFGHPAVITVAAVLVISRALRNSGAIDWLASRLLPFMSTPGRTSGALLSVIAGASAVMNNVGALAILMPVALETTQRQGRSPARLLMPLSFAALLGGLLTMIGTPPNIIIASFRDRAVGESFGMFDYTPVGLAVAVVGIAYLLLAGWRLIPAERRGANQPERMFRISDYMSEARVTAASKVIERSIASLPQAAEAEVLVTALIRGDEHRPAPSRRTRLREGDVLVLRGDPSELKGFLDATGMELVGNEDLTESELASDDVALLECVVGQGSRLIGRSARTANLRSRYGLNLLAIARQDQRIHARLDRAVMQAGDVLLLQGRSDSLADTLAHLNCLPLMGRQLRL
ncbi:MAG TPA: SLC13 family permease, partial [Alphaproteobacteria bacterium]|nr:SLC13 family permease [Alphaproteobacteria bacterium]